MTHVISFANQKGGVGKSTLCIQQAFFLAQLKKRVLVVDMDAQGNTSSRLAPWRAAEEGGDRPVFSGTDVASLFSADDLVVEPMTCPSGVDLIHTPRNDPALLEIEAMSLEQALNPRRHLEPLLARYDYVLIDCPPSLGRKLVAALAVSTHVVCPVRLSGFAVDGVEGLLNTIIGVRETCNPDLEIVGIVINDIDRSKAHRDALQALESVVPDLVLKHRIRHRPPLDTATSTGVAVWSLPYGHVAAKEVRAVLQEIVERVG